MPNVDAESDNIILETEQSQEMKRFLQTPSVININGIVDLKSVNNYKDYL